MIFPSFRCHAKESQPLMSAPGSSRCEERVFGSNDFIKEFHWPEWIFVSTCLIYVWLWESRVLSVSIVPIQMYDKPCFLVSGRLSKVFDMGEEEHDIILQKVQEANVRRCLHDSICSYCHGNKCSSILLALEVHACSSAFVLMGELGVQICIYNFHSVLYNWHMTL